MIIGVNRPGDGEIVWLSVSGYPALDSQGVLHEIVISFIDITERKVAEIAWRESRQRYAAIIEQSNDGITIADLHGRYTFVNPKFCEMTGYTEEELLTMHVSELLSKRSSHTLFAQVANEIKPGIKEGELVRKDGSTFYAMVTGSPLLVGKDRFVQGIVRDITERKKIKKELHRTSERLRLATASAKAGVWDWNLQTNEMIWDDRMKELYGLTAESFPGGIDAWTQGLHPDDASMAIDECQAAIRGDREFDTEFRVRHSDGRIVFIKANGLVLRDENGIAVRMIGLNTDITERKMAEMSLHKMEEHLRQSQKMDAIGQLAGGIAHDFNNVLSGIIGYADMSLSLVEKGSILESNQNKILQATDRAKNLVKQILAFSRQGNPQKLVTTIRPITEEVLDLHRSSIPSSVIIESDLHKEVKSVLADPTQIHQVLLNLATNAVHAMNRKGKLTVRLYATVLDHAEHGQSGEISSGEYNIIEVGDTGCGMDAATLSKAFEPFFTTKPVGEGTGMGLSVVLGIVQSHGGGLQVESRPGKGTVIKIYLPVSGEGVPDKPHTAALMPLYGDERILIVDDERILVEMVEKILIPLGYTVVGVSDSLAAWNYIRDTSHEIDLLITDQTMPGMTGIELAKEALAIRKDLPIILCTGFSNEVNRETVEEMGIGRFIPKPYRSLEIGKAIRELLDARKPK